jgi:hypothetical protein
MSTTPRSEPRPDCEHCKGTGGIRVSKDPDEVADCVCTDPPEPTAAERADEFAKSLGIELTPWQLDIASRLLAGERFVLVGGRRGGMGTVKRIVEGVQNV